VLDYGAADGFNLMPPVLSSMLDIFVAEVIPLRQKRGLFRTGYEGDTLRQQCGLGRPAVTFGGPSRFVEFPITLYNL